MPRTSPRLTPLAVKKRVLSGALIGGLLLLSLPRGTGYAASAYDWPQFGGNAAHSGDNTAESTLNASNVSGLTRLFPVPVKLPDTADGAPAYLSAVGAPDGTRDLAYVTTRAGDLVALDAHSGQQVWIQHNLAPGGCGINGGRTPCYTTSSPAIDPNRQYIYSYGLDGYAHKYNVGDGAEVKTGGWPELTTLKGVNEKGSSALTIATAKSGVSYLYVTHGGYPGDNGDYQGHVTAINLGDGTQRVFNANCSDLTIHFVEQGATSGGGQNDCAQRQTAIWARAGVVYDGDTDKIYLATGNGPFDASSATGPNHDWGDTVFALHPDGTGTGANGDPLDSYTPSNYQDLQNGDTDIGSTAPAILPVPAASTVRRLAVQAGKDANLRLLNLDNLSGQGGPRHLGGEVGTVIGVPQGGEVLTAPAVWVDSQGTTWVFVANDNGLSALTLNVNNGTPSLREVWRHTGQRTSPIVANGVLYDAGSGIIEALDPTTGQQLWHDDGIGGIHWESPIVANGVLYITDNNATLSAYALPTTPATPTNTPPAPVTPTNTPPAPTATNTPQPTATNTPPAPTATDTSQPTATNTPQPTATNTPQPTATNTPQPTATNTPPAPSQTPATTPNIAIDSGGGATGAFAADADYNGGYTAANGNAVATGRVTNPAPQAVYQSERYGNFTYTVPNLAPGAAYVVRLHFAEIFWNAAGKRVFNVAINGARVLSNFDIYATTGGQNIATVRQFPATADTAGRITIAYSTIIDNAKSSGIEVRPATSLDAGLVGYWQDDEGAGATTADASGSGNTGALAGGMTWTAGRFGDALSFDGASGYVLAGVHNLPAANAPQSISWWLNVPAIPGGVQNVLSLTNDGAGSAVQAGFRDGRIGVWKFGGAWLISTTPASAGGWRHYAYTFDGATHRLYIDGALAASATTAPQSAAPTKLAFGRWTGGAEYLKGNVDDVRIYNRALTATEVQTLDTQP